MLGQTAGLDRRTLQKARREQKQHKGRRWPKRLLITGVVLVVLVGVTAVGTYAYGRYRFDQIKKVHAPHLDTQAPPGKPFNILLVGSDTRSFVKTTPKQKIEFEGTGGTTVGGQRSDVTIVARFVPATKQVWIISIPRDLYVTIPGDGPVHGMTRINSAYNTGPDLLIQTIETDLHIPINHYMAVTFQGFQEMVNAVGGVTMTFPDPLRDHYSGLDVTQTGCQTVDGATALELVRARHLYYEQTGVWQYDGLSDFSRIQRQDAFFRALLAKLNTVKLDPLTINSFVGAAVKYLTIDDTLGEGQLISMAEQFHGLAGSNLHTETLPTTSFTTTAGADVLNPAQPYARDMIAAFNAIGTDTVPTTTSGAPKATTTTTTAPTLPTSEVDVQVLNGVDFTKPIASNTAAELKKAGFSITGVDNAPAPGVKTTQIEYAEGNEAAGQTVAASITGKTELVADPQLQGDHVVLTVGDSFTAVITTTPTAPSATGTSGTGGSSTGSGPTTTTTVPPPPSDVYTNTQPEPWNPTPCTS